MISKYLAGIPRKNGCPLSLAVRSTDGAAAMISGVSRRFIKAPVILFSYCCSPAPPFSRSEEFSLLAHNRIRRGPGLSGESKTKSFFFRFDVQRVANSPGCQGAGGCLDQLVEILSGQIHPFMFDRQNSATLIESFLQEF